MSEIEGHPVEQLLRALGKALTALFVFGGALAFFVRFSAVVYFSRQEVLYPIVRVWRQGFGS
jgi:hypothetical protein